MLQVPLVDGTVNPGSDVLTAGLTVNDWCSFRGLSTTSTEIAVISSVFKLYVAKPTNVTSELRTLIIETIYVKICEVLSLPLEQQESTRLTVIVQSLFNRYQF